MSSQGSESNLVQAAKVLSSEWQQTKSYWRDAKSLEFEKRFLEDLPGHVGRAAMAMEEINTMLKKIRRDCE